MMTCSFLQDKDYENPDAFVPNIDNTIEVEFSMAEDFPDFEERYLNLLLFFGKITLKLVFLLI